MLLPSFVSKQLAMQRLWLLRSFLWSLSVPFHHVSSKRIESHFWIIFSRYLQQFLVQCWILQQCTNRTVNHHHWAQNLGLFGQTLYSYPWYSLLLNIYGCVFQCHRNNERLHLIFWLALPYLLIQSSVWIHQAPFSFGSTGWLSARGQILPMIVSNITSVTCWYSKGDIDVAPNVVENSSHLLVSHTNWKNLRAVQLVPWRRLLAPVKHSFASFGKKQIRKYFSHYFVKFFEVWISERKMNSGP